jgi:hypothetical protein
VGWQVWEHRCRGETCGGEWGSRQGERPSISTAQICLPNVEGASHAVDLELHNLGALFLDEKEPSVTEHRERNPVYRIQIAAKSCPTIAPFRYRHWPVPELKGSRYCAYITPRYIWLRQPSEALRCGGSLEGGTKTITCQNTKSRCDVQTCW